MLKQLKKSIDIEKMPSVRVRPTLRVELKHRVMNCKVPQTTKADSINIQTLTETVIDAMKRRKRANMGGESKQASLIKLCQNEISKCKNLEEIRHSLDSKINSSTQQTSAMHGSV